MKESQHAQLPLGLHITAEIKDMMKLYSLSKVKKFCRVRFYFMVFRFYEIKQLLKTLKFKVK